MDLNKFFETAVVELNRSQSEPFGDRTQYIGSSDVAGCARKAFMQRQYPKTPSVNNLLKFARGHAAEWLLDKIFTAGGAVYDTQVEIIHPTVPFRCHIDFLFYTKSGMHVIEVKSVSGIPDAPYPQWEDQLAYQLGLLRIQYPKGDISGSILAVDLNAGEVHQFNGYAYDEPTFNYLYCKGLHLLDALSGTEEARPSSSILCGYCHYRDDCPSFDCRSVQLPPEVEMLALKYAELNDTKSQADKQMKSIRQELVDYTGTKFRGRTESLDLTVSWVEPSLTVDGALLKQNHPEIYPKVLKPRAGYTRLEVKPFKKREIPQAA